MSFYSRSACTHLPLFILFSLVNKSFSRALSYLIDECLTLSNSSRYDHSISALYRGLQCSTCGVRFDGDRAAAYSAHLDWHFRHNRRDQESLRKVSSRKWYYALEDWVQFEEISELDEAGVIFAFVAQQRSVCGSVSLSVSSRSLLDCYLIGLASFFIVFAADELSVCWMEMFVRWSVLSDRSGLVSFCLKCLLKIGFPDRSFYTSATE